MVEDKIAEQFDKRPTLIPANLKPLALGHDYVTANLTDACKLKVERADKVGDRIFIAGNDAAGLGAVYGGATVCAWYPITPSTSLAEAFTKHCKRFRVDPETKENKFAIVQAEDEIAAIGMVIGAGWNGARASPPPRARHLADAGILRACLFRRNPGGDLRHPARRAVAPACRRAPSNPTF